MSWIIYWFHIQKSAGLRSQYKLFPWHNAAFLESDILTCRDISDSVGWE